MNWTPTFFFYQCLLRSEAVPWNSLLLITCSYLQYSPRLASCSWFHFSEPRHNCHKVLVYMIHKICTWFHCVLCVILRWSVKLFDWFIHLFQGCFSALQWRHNWRDSVSNHQPHHCLLSRLFGRRSKKTSKPRVTGHCAGNSPGTVNSPHKWTVMQKMFPFDDVIMGHWVMWSQDWAKYLGDFHCVLLPARSCAHRFCAETHQKYKQKHYTTHQEINISHNGN